MQAGEATAEVEMLLVGVGALGGAEVAVVKVVAVLCWRG